MRRHWSVNRQSKASSRGFVLLYTLWMLLGGAVLFAALSAASISRSRVAAAGVASLQVRSALESAVHASVFGLLSRDQAPAGPPQTRVIVAGGLSVSTEVVDQDGLLDVNTSSVADLSAAIRAAGIPHPESLATSVVRARPVTGLVQLTQILGVDAERADCLSAVLTFSSGLARPDSRVAPTRVTQLLGLSAGRDGQQGIGGQRPGSGLGYLVTARTNTPAGQGGAIAAAIVLTGRTDRPMQVTDWHWLASATTNCPLPR